MSGLAGISRFPGKRMLLAVLAVAVVGYLMRQSWLPAIASGLMCKASDARSDAVLIDLVANHHALFDRAKELQSTGRAGSILVPVLRSAGDEKAYNVALGFIDVMCRAADIERCETFPVALVEPYSLNLARASAAELKRRNVGSVTLVTIGLRSRRSAAIYGPVLKSAGIGMQCQPVRQHRGPEDWHTSWHGVQEVVLQWGKLAYYVIFVQPRGT